MRAIFTIIVFFMTAVGASAFDKWKAEDCLTWAANVAGEDPAIVEIVDVQMASKPSDDNLACVGLGKLDNQEEKIVAWNWAWSQDKGTFDLTYKIIEP